MNTLKAGSAKAEILLDESCFPNSESVSIYGKLFVRTLVFETDERYAIMSIDMPSMFPNDLKYCKTMLAQAGIKSEHAWVTVTHSYSCLHTWPLGDDAVPGVHIPPVFTEHPEFVPIAQRITAAYRDAYHRSLEGALNDLQDARVGFGRGTCAINVNRNIETAEGWWQGANPDGFADRALQVLRFNNTADEPIAVLYNYSVQPGSAAEVIDELGGRVTSADLTGVASDYVEREYGSGCVAMFLCGASGDQVPLHKINYWEVDRHQILRRCSYGEAGFMLTQAQGSMLGNCVVKAAETAHCTDHSPTIRTVKSSYLCRCQKREDDLSRMKPSKNYKFQPAGEQELPVEVMLIGDIALVGMHPEMDGITVAQLREGSPFEQTMVVTFVNGNAKSMPQRESYDLCHYTAMNSPFVAGTAEQTRDTVLDLLRSIKNEL